MGNPDRLAQTIKTVHKDLERQLRLYAAAAAAAGVSLLAQCSDAQAEIVYTGAHYDIPLSSKLQYLDINGDGIPDFAFFNDNTGGLSNAFFVSLKIYALRSNGVVAASGFAAVLAKGAAIDASGNFAADNIMAASEVEGGSVSYNHEIFGPWSNVKNRYLGIAFNLNGEKHYGWIRLDVIDKKYPLRALVTGYAYETIPNKSIQAGQISENESNEPRSSLTNPAQCGASLGILAAGADFLSAWRREEDASQAA